MTELKDKTVIVTGAAGGIGRAIAQEAGRAGARLALVDADAARLDETVTAIRAIGAEVLPCAVDMTDRTLWQKNIDDIAAHFCGIDVMVNNAMWVEYEPMAEVQEGVYRRQMAIGLDAVFWGIQAVTPHMIAQGAGSIVNMTSPASVHG
ncbi:MAG: SDR family NAD(P)-dependent oxidoreductase, partial [Alphaproteobacteria bacterium]|nr:SDR family NAD(P)-dependent oxidoreductase [Alphaproteobacteria bacterium]